ncbi:MAG: multidrug ABC transporter substrate-binding protein [Deltaproteobacteria bacterium RBG_16_71_12]|nr:MAG: multidrug ABC transporter substrate-binding protein [Deltaproteobacteria bacterium RBG_16_71_12]
MSPLSVLRVALRALLRNKMRAGLTTLGVVIGVGAVVAMVAIGEGAKAQVQKAFESMGTDLIVVLPGSQNFGGARGGFGSGQTLTWDDLRAIQSELSAVRAAAPQLRTNTPVLGDGNNWGTQVMGTTAEFFVVRNWAVELGRPLQASDVDGATKVAVVGKTVAEQLWGEPARAVGDVLRVKGVPYEVIGVLTPKGQSPMGMDYDDVVLVPAKTFMTKVQGGIKQHIPGSILIAAKNGRESARTAQQVTALLRDRHQLADGDPDDFSIRNLAEMANAQQQGTQTLTMLLMAIAAVSLLVGGIGIMNIMLVSVTERTREIGVRMAVGARPVDVLLQFLVESLTLSVIGGAIGVGVGVGGAWLLTAKFGWPTVVRPDVIAVAVGFSALVGVAFGIYPAKKAAALDPIQALRYE